MNKNNMSELDARQIEIINKGLNDQAGDLDVSTLGRLRRARVLAIRSQQAPANQSWFMRFGQGLSVQTIINKPITQASVAMLVAVMSMSMVLAPGSPLQQDVALDRERVPSSGDKSLSEVDVLMSNEDMEFLENLEIYEWLVAEYG